MKKIIKYNLPGLGILGLVIAGSLTNNTFLLYLTIISICIAVGLVAFKKIEEGYYPYLLFAIGLAMVLQMTLAGPHLMGPDVHLEYYLARLHAGEDVWTPLRDICPAAGMGATVIPPLLQKIFQIPLLWTFKVIYPICFAFVPVILYFLFKRWMDNKIAFLGCFVFIAFPGYLLELPGIPEGMLAELFLVLTFYLILTNSLKLRYRIPLIIACGLLATFIHYSVGVILIAFLGIAFLARLFLHVREGLPHKAMAGIFVVVLVGSFAYFSIAASGAVMVKLSGIYNSWVPTSLEVHLWEYPSINKEAPQPLESTDPLDIPEKEEPERGKPVPEAPPPSAPSPEELIPAEPTIPEPTPPAPPVEPPPTKPWLQRFHPLMRVALGLDFLEVGFSGKTFRVIQWVIGLGVPIGLFLLRKKKEFWVFGIGAIMVILACMNPRISPILNASRFAHLALFMLAPTIILGGKFIFRHLRVFVVFLLIPYFLFTSGLIFEATQCKGIDTISIPYSMGLSGQRIDLGASVTTNDLEVVDWIGEDGTTFPIFGDIIGTSTLNEKLGYRPDLVRALYKYPHFMPRPPYYVFIRERNIEDETFVIYKGIGQRAFYTPAQYDLNMNKNVVYQVGEARVIYVDVAAQWEELERKRLIYASLQEDLQKHGEELSPEDQYEFTRIRFWLRVLEAKLAEEE